MGWKESRDGKSLIKVSFYFEICIYKFFIFFWKVEQNGVMQSVVTSNMACCAQNSILLRHYLWLQNTPQLWCDVVVKATTTATLSRIKWCGLQFRTFHPTKRVESDSIPTRCNPQSHAISKAVITPQSSITTILEFLMFLANPNCYRPSISQNTPPHPAICWAILQNRAINISFDPPLWRSHIANVP